MRKTISAHCRYIGRVLCVGSAVLLLVFAINAVAEATHQPIPDEAQCTGPHDTVRRYECKGTAPSTPDTPGASFTAVPMDAGCIDECNAAGGHSLQYKPERGRVDWYCYAAVEDRSCTAGGKTISVKTGEVSEPECTSVFCALGNIFKVVKNLPSFLFIGLPVALLTIAGFLTAEVIGVLAGSIGAILGWIIASSLNVGVVPGSGIEVVTRGWQLSRDLVNMLFLVILVFIGLATILRIQSYQAQKTLPLLLIVALLVNFSGVLVGFVVDVSNLVINFFVSKISGFTVAFPLMKAVAGELAKGIAGLVVNTIDSPSEYISQLIQPLAKIVLILLFFLILLLVLFVAVFLFVVRLVILWVLTIVAPLAFAAYILPATRRFWNQWWQQLIQWSLIGIPLAFFLYLASLIMSGADQQAIANILLSSGVPAPPRVAEGLSPDSISGATPPGAIEGLIAAFIPPAAALVLLSIGLMTSMSLAPAAASGVIGLGKKAGAGAYNLVGQRGWKAVRDKVPGGTRKTMEEMSLRANPTWGQGEKGIGGFLQRRAAGVAGYTTRTAGGLAKSAVLGSEQADADKAKAKALKQDVVSNVKGLRQTASLAERAAIMDAMRQKNQIKDALNADVVGEKNKLKKDEVTDIYRKAHETRNGDLAEGLERAFVNDGEVVAEFARITDDMATSAVDQNDRTGPKWGRASGLDRKDVEERGYKSFAEKIIGEAKTADEIKALQKNWWNNNDLMNAAHKFWGGNQISQAAVNFGRDFTNQLEATKKDKDADWYFALEERKDSKGNVAYAPRNTAMPRYLASSAAQGLGISPVEGLERPSDINRKSAIANAWAPYLSQLGAPYQKFQNAAAAKGELERQKKLGVLSNDEMQKLEDTVRTNFIDLETELALHADEKVRTLWTRVQDAIRPAQTQASTKGRRQRQQSP